MPVFAEIGPLIMNKEIETKVMTMLEKSECVMTSKMDSMNFSLLKDGKNYQTPRMPDKNRPEFSQFACQHRRRQKAFQRRNLQVPPGIELPLHKNLQDDE